MIQIQKNHMFIYQHMGLGDHIMCNGLVRTIIDKKNQYIMFVKEHNYGSVSYMYRDIPNLRFLIGDDAAAINFLNANAVPQNQVKLIGFNWVDPTNHNLEENFYMQHQIDPHKKWDSFYCERDEQAEQKVYEHFSINEDYIFVHDDSRYHIDESKLPQGLRIIRPQIGVVDSIFCYAKVMEKAKQLHLMESCFGWMAELMKLNPELYMHRYSRNPSKFETPTYRNVKEIYT